MAMTTTSDQRGYGLLSDMAITTPVEAATTVFSTYELLENILSNLSMRDLVKAQQVDKQWHSLTARSKVLRRNLFLEAKLPKVLRNLAEKSPAAMDDSEFKRTPELVMPHPILGRTFLPDSGRSRWFYMLSTEEVKRLLSWRDYHKGGLWKKMFVVQPPPNEVEVSIFFEEETGTVHLYHTKRFWAGRGGVRLFSVVEYLHGKHQQWKKLKDERKLMATTEMKDRWLVFVRGVAHQRNASDRAALS